MSERGGWPGEDSAETQVTALTPAEREVLAAVAVVGRASLSTAELAALSEVADVTPVIEELERRGLIRQDERKRYSAARRIGEEIRNTDAALAKGDRLLNYMTTLAKSGELTPARLLEDSEAILGLSEWAAEHRQWAGLLELVKTLQSCFAIARRVEAWMSLLEHGRTAAQALGDRRSEVWVLQQMATASESAGDTEAAQRYLREANQLQSRRSRRSGRSDDGAAARRSDLRGGVPRVALWAVGLLVAAGAGVGAGYALGNSDGSAGVVTTQVSATVTVGGRTIRTSDTVTLPATTVISTSIELSTTTVTNTTTVTTSVVG